MRPPRSTCLDPPLPSPPLQGNACKKAKTAWVSPATAGGDELINARTARRPRALGAGPGQPGLVCCFVGRALAQVSAFQEVSCGVPCGLLGAIAVRQLTLLARQVAGQPCCTQQP